MSFHFIDVPTNVLTINEYDPISGTAEFKACAVKITPLAAEKYLKCNNQKGKVHHCFKV